MTAQRPDVASLPVAAKPASGAAHIDALTSLRFFAALYVLLLHSGSSAIMSAVSLPGFFQRFLANGYLGVNFFFVLSGFILAHVYQGRLEGPYFSAATWRYGVARFARVYPVYLLALVLTIAASPGILGWHRLPQLALLQCWLPPVYADNSLNDNGPAWTLSVELFFYLSFPFILKRAERLRTRTILAVVVALFAAMVEFRLPTMGTGREGFAGMNPWMFYVPLPLLRTPEFIYGLLLGIVHRRAVVASLPWTVYAAIATTLVALCVTTAPWVASAATICFGALILLVAVNLPQTALARPLGSRALVLLGGASYAVYLLQQPVHMWLWILAGNQSVVARLAYAPSLVLLSVVVFLYYETPLRELLRRVISSPKTHPRLDAVGQVGRPQSRLTLHLARKPGSIGRPQRPGDRGQL